MKALYHAVLCALAAVACTVSPAGATTVQRGELDIDCDGYTVTFTSNFVPGESALVSWQIVLVQGGDRVTVSDAQVITGTTTSFERAWPQDLCGYKVLAPSEDDGQGSFWQYPDPTSPDELLRDAFDEARVVGPVVECPCAVDVDAICRTPGFWGTHAGTEKKGSVNVTQAVLDEAGFALVCGQPISTTALDTASSAVEAMCVSPKGDPTLQLARQLTAAALNCIVSGGGADCSGLPVASTFAACDAACTGAPSSLTVSECIAAVDCFNNGGVLHENGFCQLGTCGGDGVTACDGDEACLPDPLTGQALACVPTPGNCHDRPLVNEALGLDFDPPGPAGSSKACNDANKNGCTIFDCPAPRK